MGSANQQYPMAIQAKLPLPTSARLSKPFKPPSKSRERGSDATLPNDELRNLYSSGTQEKEEEAQGLGHKTKILRPSLSK